MEISKKFFYEMYDFFNSIMLEGITPTLEQERKFFADNVELYINAKKRASNVEEIMEHMVGMQKNFVSWKFVVKDIIIGNENKAATYHTIDIIKQDQSNDKSYILNMWEFENGKIIKWFAIVYPSVN